MLSRLHFFNCFQISCEETPAKAKAISQPPGRLTEADDHKKSDLTFAASVRLTRGIISITAIIIFTSFRADRPVFAHTSHSRGCKLYHEWTGPRTAAERQIRAIVLHLSPRVNTPRAAGSVAHRGSGLRQQRTGE